MTTTTFTFVCSAGHVWSAVPLSVDLDGCQASPCKGHPCGLPLVKLPPDPALIEAFSQAGAQGVLTLLRHRAAAVR